MTTRDNVASLPTAQPFTEIGWSGPSTVSTHIYDDFLPQLRGRKALETYREMGDNDATIGSILFAIEMLVRSVEWTVTDASEDALDLVAGDFLRDNINGLDHSLRDTFGQQLGAARYGFSFHETVYRRDDQGRVMWAKFGLRPQSSLQRWILDDRNNPVGFQQQVSGEKLVSIPVEKGILFRVDTSAPSGRSLLRPAYRSWFFKKLTEEKLMIGIDRNLNGIPMAEIPPEILVAGEGNAVYDIIKKITTRTKKDEQAGLLWPLEFDENGNPKYRFSLLSPDGNPRFDQVLAVIRAFAQDIAAVVLAQFVGLGRDAVGSRALAEPQQDLFQNALEAILDGMQDAFNRQAVERLFELNPGLIAEGRPLPTLQHGEIRDVDLEQLGVYVHRMTQSGADLPWDDPKFQTDMFALAGIDITNDLATTSYTKD